MNNKTLAESVKDLGLTTRDQISAYMAGRRYRYTYRESTKYPEGTIFDFTSKPPVLTSSLNAIVLDPNYNAGFKYMIEVGGDKASLESYIEAEEAKIEECADNIKSAKLKIKIMDELEIDILTPEIEKAYNIINVIDKTSDLKSMIETISKIIAS